MNAPRLLRGFPAFRQMIKRSYHEEHHHGPPQVGDNLPFSIKNRWGLTLKFILFVGSAAALPFYVVKFQLLKKQQT